ncbi:MAG: hypothetical protein ACRC7S_05730 [Cetobacterium sp.]
MTKREFISMFTKDEMYVSGKNMKLVERANFVATLLDNGKFCIYKNRIGKCGTASKYYVRKELKKLRALGYGSNTWIIK